MQKYDFFFVLAAEWSNFVKKMLLLQSETIFIKNVRRDRK